MNDIQGGPEKTGPLYSVLCVTSLNLYDDDDDDDDVWNIAVCIYLLSAEW